MTMAARSTTRRTILAATVAALAFVVGACSDDDEGSDPDTSVTQPAGTGASTTVASGAPTATTPPPDGGAPEVDPAAYEACAAVARQALDDAEAGRMTLQRLGELNEAYETAGCNTICGPLLNPTDDRCRP